jgi:hypothetical protein
MDERIETLLTEIDRGDLAKVAAQVLGASVEDAGPLSYTEITTPHAEKRTVAIVKVAGRAHGQPWSSVVKVLDMSVPAQPRFAGVTAPETEEIVYEEGYFSGGTGLRAARCYLISRPSSTLKLLWLEDLTSALGPPFGLAPLTEMARHFGAWNGRHARHVPELKLPLLRNAFGFRFASWSFEKKLEQLDEFRDHKAVRGMYRDHPLSVAADFLDAVSRLVKWGQTVPGTLAYGDCSAGNLFYRPGETIGIDWASLTIDPTGVDAGCLIGSSTTWGREFVAVARSERQLFESYCEGLEESGWTAGHDDIRRGYFCLFGFYLGATLTMPINIVGADQFLARGYLEKRYGMSVEEIPEAAGGIVDLAPELTREINTLLGD